MARFIIGAIVLASAAAGCSGTREGSPETLAKVQQPIFIDRSCKGFDGYTAALAEATIDCLGSIGPSDYKVAVDPLDTGAAPTPILVPTFDSCPAEPVPPPREVGGTAQSVPVSALSRIHSILRIQRSAPPTTLADGTLLELKCIRDAYNNAAANLKQRGVTVVPNWHRQFAGGVPTKKRITALAARYPKPSKNEKGLWTVNLPQPGSPPPLGFRFPKEYFFYTVSWDNKPAQTCTDPACPPGCAKGDPVACATEVASTLFEGFFVGRFGKYLVGDPYLWLDPTVYDDWTDANDPYRVNGYYHPMSLTGGDPTQVPGPIYGDFARAKFDDSYDPASGSTNGAPSCCDDLGHAYTTPSADNQAELCTRWDGTDHRVGRLVQDKLLGSARPDTWLSVCEFWPPTYGDPFTYSFGP
jgi:hypothetical protein